MKMMVDADAELQAKQPASSSTSKFPMREPLGTSREAPSAEYPFEALLCDPDEESLVPRLLGSEEGSTSAVESRKHDAHKKMMVAKKSALSVLNPIQVKVAMVISKMHHQSPLRPTRAPVSPVVQVLALSLRCR